MMSIALEPAEVAEAYREACRFDVIAFKPGNVSCDAPGHDMDARDFLRSAAVSAPWLAAPNLAVGARIAGAIAATREAVGCNTNLGIVLLAAPLASAALTPHPRPALRPRLVAQLAGLTVADAAGAFEGIRLAAPGGLGTAPEADVHAPPSLDLRQAMALAADRDGLARQYVSDYADVFELGLPALVAAMPGAEGLGMAVQAAYLALLTARDDSHIARKYGSVIATQVRMQAAAVACPGKACENPAAFSDALHALDRELKSRGYNPGTTADLTVASLFAHLLTQALQQREARGQRTEEPRWHGIPGGASL